MATPLHPLLFCPLYVTCHTVQHGNHFHLAHKLTEILTTFYISAIITDTWQKIWVCYIQTQESPPKRPAEKGGTFSQTGTGGGVLRILTIFTSERSVGTLCDEKFSHSQGGQLGSSVGDEKLSHDQEGHLGPCVGDEKWSLFKVSWDPLLVKKNKPCLFVHVLHFVFKLWKLN